MKKKTTFSHKTMLPTEARRRYLADEEKRTLLPPEQRSHLIEFETRNGGHCCVEVTFDHFMSSLIKNQHLVKYFHEVIWPDKPCRFYLDCDRDLQPNETIDETAFISNITKQVKHLFPTSCAEPAIIQCHRPTKFSIHLIWTDIQCVTPRDVCSYAKKLSTLQNVTIDIQAYPCGTSPKTLRMPWCQKMEHPGFPFLPKGSSRAFDPEMFCKCLVTFNPEDSLKWKIPAPELFVVGTERPLHSMENHFQDHSIPPIIQSSLRWMEQSIPGFSSSYFKLNTSNGDWECICSMACPQMGKVHKSNATYLHGQINGRMYFRCCNFECRKRIPVMFSVQDAALSESKVDIDWNTLDIVYARQQTLHKRVKEST
jgi:hypothetical protein